MKITKRQLRRIIKEEKRKLLRESVADGIEFEKPIEHAARGITDVYVAQMGEELYDEDPGMFDGHSTRDEWLEQVDNAAVELETQIINAIRKAIGENETMLHDGQFTRIMDY